MKPNESIAQPSVSIWFIVGISLLVNGIIVFGTGIYEIIQPPVPEMRVVLFQYHASVWWGGLLALLGVIYCWRYAPRQSRS